MGIPVITTPQDFRSYVAGVHMRRDFKPPQAFAIGAVRMSEQGELIEAHFPKVNVGENFGSAAAFADVTHHRSGSAVRALDFFELKELEQLFWPFLSDVEHHPNVSAFLDVYRLACSPHNLKPIVVFVGDDADDSCMDNPVFEAFKKQLATVTEPSTAVH